MGLGTTILGCLQGILAFMAKQAGLKARYWFKASNNSYNVGALPANLVPFYGGKFGSTWQYSIFPTFYTSVKTLIKTWDWSLKILNWTGWRTFNKFDKDDYGGIEPPGVEQIVHFIAALFKWTASTDVAREKDPFTDMKIYNDTLNELVVNDMTSIYSKNEVPEDQFVQTDEDTTKVIWVFDGAVLPFNIYDQHITQGSGGRGIPLSANTSLLMGIVISTNWIKPDNFGNQNQLSPSWCGNTGFPLLLFQSTFRYTESDFTDREIYLEEDGDPEAEEPPSTIVLDIAGVDTHID